MNGKWFLQNIINKGPSKSQLGIDAAVWFPATIWQYVMAILDEDFEYVYSPISRAQQVIGAEIYQTVEIPTTHSGGNAVIN